MISTERASAHDWLLFRAAQSRLHGAALPDEQVVAWACRRCGEEDLVVEHHVQHGVPYRAIDGLVELATRSATELAQRAQRCGVCDGERTATRIDYHVSHSVALCDLVVRWQPKALPLGRQRVELLWWDADLGYQRLAMLSDEEADAIGHDAILRALRLAWECGGMSRALPLLEEASEAIPGEAALMDFVSALWQAGHAPLARAIVTGRVAAAPDDALAAYWLGYLIVQDVARGDWPLEALIDAEFSLARAIARRPDYPAAELAKAHAARLRGRDDLARERLAALLDRHPDHVEAACTLGTLQLANDPEAAQHSFARALAAAPDDADCARGLALAQALLSSHSGCDDLLEAPEHDAPELASA